MIRTAVAVQLQLPTPTETLALKWLTFAATAAIFAWVAQYTLSSPWWRDPIGRTIAVKDLFLLGFLVPSCLNFLWPGLISVTDLVFFDIALLAGMTLVMLWRCVIWYRLKPASNWITAAYWQRLRSVLSHKGEYTEIPGEEEQDRS